jgi:transposase InsO family protein
MFNRQFAHTHLTISKSWLNNVLIKHRTQAKIAHQAYKNTIPKPQPKNATWALDTTQLCKDSPNILGIIDHGTRRCLCLKALSKMNAWTILGQICLAIGKFGKPLKIKSDNHPIFHSLTWYMLLGLIGIKIEHSAPHSPWQNGRIERFFGTLKSTIRMFAPDHANILIHRTLTAFEHYYNYHRPHQNLQHLTPVEAWAITKLPKKRKPPTKKIN